MELELSYYTIEQACQKLQLSRNSILKAIKLGQIPKAEFSEKILIPAWFFRQAEGRGIYEADLKEGKQ